MSKQIRCSAADKPDTGVILFHDKGKGIPHFLPNAKSLVLTLIGANCHKSAMEDV